MSLDKKIAEIKDETEKLDELFQKSFNELIDLELDNVQGVSDVSTELNTLKQDFFYLREELQRIIEAKELHLDQDNLELNQSLNQRIEALSQQINFNYLAYKKIAQSVESLRATSRLKKFKDNM